jgi:hypothetical protein
MNHIFSPGKIIKKTEEVLEVVKSSLGLSAEVLYQLCGNGSI